MNIFQQNTNRLKFLFAINFSFFSALAICQLLLTAIYNPWFFLLCILGSCINLFVLYFIFQHKIPRETGKETSVTDSEKNMLMDDLEEEAKRRKNHDRIQQN